MDFLHSNSFSFTFLPQRLVYRRFNRLKRGVEELIPETVETVGSHVQEMTQGVDRVVGHTKHAVADLVGAVTHPVVEVADTVERVVFDDLAAGPVTLVKGELRSLERATRGTYVALRDEGLWPATKMFVRDGLYQAAVATPVKTVINTVKGGIKAVRDTFRGTLGAFGKFLGLEGHGLRERGLVPAIVDGFRAVRTSPEMILGNRKPSLDYKLDTSAPLSNRSGATWWKPWTWGTRSKTVVASAPSASTPPARTSSALGNSDAGAAASQAGGETPAAAA